MKRFACIFFLLLWWQNSFATTVRLVTIGPGDAFWSAFGHSAIAIDDVVYGFGYFSFDDDVILSFVKNSMQYDLGVSDLNHEIRLAQQQNRDFSVIEIQLSVTESAQLSDYLTWHMLPENQSYRYDYFLNNCSTKVRDLLALIWGEQLRQSSQIATDHDIKHSYFDQTFPAKHQGLMNFGLALGYGWPAYTARNNWELMAFPVYLEHYLINDYNDKLAPRQLIYQATEGHSFISMIKSHWFLIGYVLIWTLFLTFKNTQQFMSKAWFVWHGMIGLILLALWLLTPHTVVDWNFNVLLMMPLGLFVIKFQKLIPVLLFAWILWLLIVLYLNAWYLIPTLLPAMLALKTVSKEQRVSNIKRLTFGGVI